VQPTPEVVLALVFLPFAAAALVPAAFRVLGERTAYYAAAAALGCLALVVQLIRTGARGTVTLPWIPSLDVSLAFHVDGLSLLIALLASAVGVLILTYSGGYMHGEPAQARYYGSLLVFLGSMLGVAMAADLISLFVFWELTSLSSFLLIGHYSNESASQYAARKSMLVTVSGGLFMLVGFLLLARTAGTFALFGTADAILANPGAVRTALVEAGLLVPVLGLLAVGAATKSAQVPFHVWLPNAMEAPTPVSAFLHSATMVKAGVYLVGRMRPLFVTPEAAALEAALGEWSLLFVALGLLTMTVAAVLAVSATDIKELLAYSTASHLGLIVAGFGFAVEIGAETGAFHVLNHASFKAALFLVAGIVAHEAGTREIASLGGLRRDLPVTAAVATVASLSMAGIPPFNGFISKEFLFDAAWETGAHYGGLTWLFPVVAVLGSVFTFLYSIRFLMLFWGDRPEELGHVHRPPLAMLVPPVLLGLAVLYITATPVLPGETFVERFVGAAFAASAVGDPHAVEIYLPDHVTPPVVMSGVTIALGLVAYPQYDRLHRGVRGVLAGPVRANWWYDAGVDGLAAASAALTPRVHTELLRTYAAWALGATAALALGGYAAAGVSLPAIPGLGVTTSLAIVLLVASLGAVSVGFAPSHVAGVLTLSIVGFMIAILYILADAPDLALTQLAVETLVLVIFLLVLDRLPAFYGETPFRESIRDGALALVVGATVTVTVLVTTAASPNDGLAAFLLENAGVPAEHGPFFTDAGGGGNVVNVILVDFRAFDTMGEICVVALAAVGILTLVRMRERGETQ
jgi:multicomponent Na+:H+ antiporter subunit A